MQLSIIVPTKASQNILELASIVKMAEGLLGSFVEVIIVSTKATEWQTTANYKAITQSGKGLYNAINSGIRASTGMHIIVLGDDDSISVTRKLIDFLVENNQHVVIADVLSGDKILKNSFSRYRSILRNNNHHQGYFIPRSFHEDKLYDESFTVAGDFELITSLISQGWTYTKYDEPVSRHDTRGLSNSKNVLGYWEDVRVYYKYYKFLFPITLFATALRYLRKLLVR